jgi:flagellar biosynthesis protein FlhB
MAEDGEKPDESSKTEEPTTKKLEEARKRGQVAQSKEINSFVILLIITLVIAIGSQPIFSNFTDFLKVFLEQPHLLPSMPGGLGTILGDTFLKTVGFIFLIFAALIVAAIFGPFAQVGPMFAPEVIKPELSKISIIKGFQRLFSLKSVVEFIKGLLKIFVIGLVGYFLTAPYFNAIEITVDQPLEQLLYDMYMLTLRIMVGFVVVMMLIGIADLLYQRWEFTKEMRMTKQEVKDEYKQTEGDPYIKGKLKQLRMEKARARMMQAVPKADVVITNPTHYAVALQYKADEMDAPMVIAKGHDEVALRIREVAKEHEIIIMENPPLARSLYDSVEIDQMIPPELYKAVAEIITFVFQKQGKLKKKS